MKYKIAVSGASQIEVCQDRVIKLAEMVGKEIVRQGCVLLTGATTGVPYFAARGAKKQGGLSIGFSPAASKLAHQKVYKLPFEHLDLVVYTGFDYSGRNLLLTRSSDGVIVICGRIGTLNEFTIAFEDRTPIAVLEGSGGTADLIKSIISRPHRKGPKIIYDTDPKRLVQRLIKTIEKGRRK